MPKLKLKYALKTVFTGCFLTLTLATQSVVFAQEISDAHHSQQTLDWPEYIMVSRLVTIAKASKPHSH